MKAERRHELRSNSLALALIHFPTTLRQNIGTILTIILGIALVAVLLKYRIDAAQQRDAAAHDNLAIATETVQIIKSFELRPWIDRSQLDAQFQDASSRLDSVMATLGSDPHVGAVALETRADLNWAMAELSSAATTQPSDSAHATADYVKAAQAAWQQIIKDYPQEEFSVCAARLGLAAAAENQRDWAQAGTYYKALLDDTNAPVELKREAQKFSSSLAQLALPLYMAPGQGSLGGPATQNSQPAASTRP
jgi:hypothetical protein